MRVVRSTGSNLHIESPCKVHRVLSQHQCFDRGHHLVCIWTVAWRISSPLSVPLPLLLAQFSLEDGVLPTDSGQGCGPEMLAGLAVGPGALCLLGIVTALMAS